MSTPPTLYNNIPPASSAQGWLAERRAQHQLIIKPIAWENCLNWHWQHNQIQHVTGRFFSIGGIHTTANIAALNGNTQPIILQPEIGLLGFIICPTSTGYRWLLQAKTEPGNVGGMQVAPSVQATLSNFERVHGGSATLYLDLFADKNNSISNSLQTEQGWRFLNKHNRNAVVEVAQIFATPPNWHWCNSQELQNFLAADYCLNTDARSVIASAPWALLGADIFQGRTHDSPWRQALCQSYAAPVIAKDIEQQLASWRQSLEIETQQTALLSLPNWQKNSHAFVNPNARFSIEAYAVTAPDREVPHWCQPLLRGLYQEDIVLLACQQHGIMHFYLSAAYEPGYGKNVQLGASFMSGTNNNHAQLAALIATHGQTQQLLQQSDEGSRFMQACATYRIVEIAEGHLPALAENLPAHGLWVNLAELEMLCRQQSTCTNELRTFASLLLALA